MGPDRRHPLNPSPQGSRHSTPINPSIPNAALRWSRVARPRAAGRTDRRRNRAARCFGAINCSSTARSWAGTGRQRRGASRYGVASGQLGRTPGPDGRSVFTARTPDVPQACDAAAGLASPSAKSLAIPTVSLLVQSAAQGEYAAVGIVQHVGSPIAGVGVTRARGRRGSCGARLGRNPDQHLVWRTLGRASIPHIGSGQSAAGVFSSSPRNGKVRPALSHTASIKRRTARASQSILSIGASQYSDIT